jgi:four helix bundle protein
MPFLFEDLQVYKKAIEFTVVIFDICKVFSDREIKDQLKRAALSIPLNIAEGQGRVHHKEKKNFYNIAKGSLYELKFAINCII